MTNWKEITTLDEVNDIIAASDHRTQIIFKDSLTCGISAFAKEKLTLGSDLLTENADFHYLDLLQYRAISDYIAKELGVTHHSPQVIVLKNRKVVYKVSHHKIDPHEIKNYV